MRFTCGDRVAMSSPPHPCASVLQEARKPRFSTDPSVLKTRSTLRSRSTDDEVTAHGEWVFYEVTGFFIQKIAYANFAAFVNFVYKI